MKSLLSNILLALDSYRWRAAGKYHAWHGDHLRAAWCFQWANEHDPWKRREATQAFQRGEITQNDREYTVVWNPLDGGPAAYLGHSWRETYWLRKGGFYYDLRFGQDERGFVTFEGSGKLLGPMNDYEIAQYLAWKYKPREVNDWAILPMSSIPKDKIFRGAWKLEDAA